MYDEWVNQPPIFAYHRFTCKGGAYFTPKMSLVVSYNGDLVYNYSTSIAYSTIPTTNLPITAKIFAAHCNSLPLTPDIAHVALYPNGKHFIDWHNDNPIQQGSTVSALRLGCPRIVLLRRANSPETQIQFILYEGDMWTMNWNAQQERQHCIPRIRPSDIDELLEKKNANLFLQ